MPRLEGVAVAPEMPRQVETTAVTVEARMAMGMAATGTDEKEMELKEEAVETCQEVWALGSAVVEAVEAVGVVPCLVATVVATAVAAHQATAAVVG